MPARAPGAASSARVRPAPRARTVAPGPAPSLRLERELLTEDVLRLAGMDEVGRGALGGPVSVGVVVVTVATRRPPTGLRDSKLLTPAARQALVPRVLRWSTASAVGHAGPEEIDAYGILAALRLAGHRALVRLGEPVDAVLLDGNHDWLTPPVPREHDLVDALDEATAAPLSLPPVRIPPPLPPLHLPRVRVRVKADLTCASVAAASVLAKCERDALMRRLALEHPGFGWEVNKGYATPAHLAAIEERGPCPAHRRSWRLPGQRVGEDGDDAAWPGGEDLVEEPA